MSQDPLSYLNDRFVLASNFAIPLTDAGFVWGATVTDRLRTFRQKLFRLDDHLRRFRQSCAKALIPQPRTDDELASIAHDLVEANAKLLSADSELSLVIFATPGSEAGSPTLGMQATPLDFEKYAPLFRDGAILEPVPCPYPLDPAIKHRSRLAWWIAKEQASPGSEPLFTTGEPAHFVRETPSANFLAVIDGELVSPPRSTILSGISLRVIEELAASLNIRFVERELSRRDAMASASECFLTNSSFCIAPVVRIAPRGENGTGWISQISNPISAFRIPHFPTFRRLLQAWSDLVGVDILQQFLTNR